MRRVTNGILNYRGYLGLLKVNAVTHDAIMQRTPDKAVNILHDAILKSAECRAKLGIYANDIAKEKKLLLFAYKKINLK